MKRYDLLILLLPYTLFSDSHNGILQHAPNNNNLYFKVEGVAITCKPYGVISLHEILYDANASDQCRESILNYFHQNPKDYYFSNYHLQLQQKYHLEYKKESCIIHSKGSVSYARELLQDGLAKVKQGLQDTLWSRKYREEESGAKLLKKGMFHSKIPMSCQMEFREQ